MNQLDRARKEDRRREHTHWLVTVSYADQELFGRVYTDREKAERFAARQLRSPQVKDAKVKKSARKLWSRSFHGGRVRVENAGERDFAGGPASRIRQWT